MSSGESGVPTTPYQAQIDNMSNAGGIVSSSTTVNGSATPTAEFSSSSPYQAMTTPDHHHHSTSSGGGRTPINGGSVPTPTALSFQPQQQGSNDSNLTSTTPMNVPAPNDHGVPASPYQAVTDNNTGTSSPWIPSTNNAGTGGIMGQQQQQQRFDPSRASFMSQESIQFEEYDANRDLSGTTDYKVRALAAASQNVGIGGGTQTAGTLNGGNGGHSGITQGGGGDPAMTTVEANKQTINDVGSVSGGSVKSLGTWSITMESSKQALLSKLQHDIKFEQYNEKQITDINHKGLVIALYMGCCAILGCLLRICIAQYFGEECKNPGTVGWLAASSPLCVTAQGQATQSGGIVFADLPANMVGSWLMGLFQTCAVLKLTTHSKPLAFLSTESPLQSWDIMILAIRTGFCGSLTTFSSWNSEMIVMMYGTGAHEINQWVQALFGYIIGMETAYGSYTVGKKCAVYLHRLCNPKLKEEADQLQDCGNGILGHATASPFTSVSPNGGVLFHRHVHLNTKIPDFERRFLIGMVEEDEMTSGAWDPTMLCFLEKWRLSTYDQRSDVYVAPEALMALHEIERVLLVLHQEPTDTYKEIAQEYHWNIKALKVWTKWRVDNEQSVPKSMWLQDQCFLFRLPVALAIFGLMFITPLMLGLLMADIESDYGFTYRTMWMAALWAPIGAICRWKLSKLNGSLTGEWKWLPLGTITANVIGCFVSISAIAIEYRLKNNNEYWRGCFLRAIKIGFAGCLTTVSTFISEVDTLNQGFPRFHWDWKYTWMSLGGCFVLSMSTYGVIAYVIPYKN